MIPNRGYCEAIMAYSRSTKRCLGALLFSALIVCGNSCAQLTGNDLKLSTIEPSGVKYVVFCVEVWRDFAPSDPEVANLPEFKELFRVSDAAVVMELFDALKETEGAPPRSVDFVGTLPWQVFVGRQGQVIADAYITCSDSSVKVGRGMVLDDGGHLFHGEGPSGPGGINRRYGKLVYDLLKKHAPDEISKRDKMYQAMAGETLAQMLCIEGPHQNK